MNTDRTLNDLIDEIDGYVDARIYDASQFDNEYRSTTANSNRLFSALRAYVRAEIAATLMTTPAL